MGGGKKKKTKKKKTKVQQAAAKRHANFKKTGVQTHGGTRKSYSKKEATKIGQLGKVGNESSSQAFSRITGGAANPLNRAPSTAGVKVGEMKPEFTSSLTGTDYSKLAAPKVNYNYSERPKSDISFSDAVRGGARFNQAGRNDLTGGKNLATHDNRLFKSVPATGPAGDQPASDAVKEGMLQKNITPSSPGNLYGIKLAASDPTQLTGIGTTPSASYTSTTGLDSVIRQGLGMDETAGGLNLGSSAFGLSAEQSDRLGRALTDGPSPRMLSEGGDLQFSDMFNADTPGARIAGGINTVKNRIPLFNRLPDMKINSVAEEAQRRYLGYNPNLPASALRRTMGSGGSRLPAAPLTPEEILLPEQIGAQTGPDYQQTGLDNNRLMQIQQEAYQQAFNPYNPMTVGGFNPMFRFFGNRQGPRRGAFRRAFSRPTTG